MATICVPRDLLAWFVVGARRILLSACTVALLSCGGGQSGPAAPVNSVEPAGADSADGPSIALNPPGTVGQGNRIGLTWQASSSLTSFTVFVRREAGIGFEAVAAAVDGNSAQFARGASWKLDFPTSSVRVRGCDASNQCVDSNEQPLLDALLAGIARPTASAEAFFEIDNFSADGNTLAVWQLKIGPPIEGQACATNVGVGLVLVFHRDGNGRWTQEANLNRFTVPGAFGPGLALSGDGNTLIVGADTDSGTVGGINAPEIGTVIPPNLPQDHRGAIHVYTRDAQHQWSHQAFIKPAVTVANERFGFRVEVTHDGNRVLVAAAERLYLFEREAGQWRQAKKIFESPPGSVMNFQGLAISPNGAAIAVRTVPAKGPDGDPFAAVRVHTPCNCDDGWREVAVLRSGKPDRVFEFFGTTLSFSGDGTMLAVGAEGDSATENGGPASFSSLSLASGAVYIFAADGGSWQLRAFLKSKFALPCDRFGRHVVLSGDGKVLVGMTVGLVADVSGHGGLRRNQRADAMTGFSGSVCEGEIQRASHSAYVFEADASGSWSHTAVVLPAPGESAFFSSLAMSADAGTLGMTFGNNGAELIVY